MEAFVCREYPSHLVTDQIKRAESNPFPQQEPKPDQEVRLITTYPMASRPLTKFLERVKKFSRPPPITKTF